VRKKNIFIASDMPLFPINLVCRWRLLPQWSCTNYSFFCDYQK